jgi:hypothetical protein
MGVAVKGQIFIYAELLSNIRQVSIAATLPSPSNSKTEVRVLDDGRRLRIEHDGLTEMLDLPGAVSGNTQLPVPQAASHDLTWRLPLSAGTAQIPHFLPESQTVPWAALELEPGSAVCCRNCSSVVIPKDIIQSWKDLPSENWAEMMEFWHCHKPHDHDKSQNETLENKGYGANSAIRAQSGVGFVDITSFMFDETNCQNLLVSSAQLGAIAAVCCVFSIYTGKKKVTRSALDGCPVVWSPIQFPKIISFCQSLSRAHPRP